MNRNGTQTITAVSAALRMRSYYVVPYERKTRKKVLSSYAKIKTADILCRPFM